MKNLLTLTILTILVGCNGKVDNLPPVVEVEDNRLVIYRPYYSTATYAEPCVEEQTATTKTKCVPSNETNKLSVLKDLRLLSFKYNDVSPDNSYTQWNFSWDSSPTNSENFIMDDDVVMQINFKDNGKFDMINNFAGVSAWKIVNGEMLVEYSNPAIPHTISDFIFE